MTRIRRTWLVLVVVGIALVAAACGSNSSGPATISIGSLRAAAENSQAADTQTFEFTMAVDAKGEHLDVDGSGIVATDGSSGRFTMDMGGLGTIESIVTPDGYYMNMGSLMEGKLPEGKQWMFVSYDAMSAKTGQDLRKLREQNSQNSAQALEYLQSTTGDVEKVGEDTVNGAPATHYVTQLDYAKLAEEKLPDASDAEKAKLAKLGKVPMDVWIDGQDRVVKMRFAMDGSSMGADGGKVEMTMEITAFGEPIDATPPPADQVFDASAMLSGQSAA